MGQKRYITLYQVPGHYYFVHPILSRGILCPVLLKIIYRLENGIETGYHLK